MTPVQRFFLVALFGLIAWSCGMDAHRNLQESLDERVHSSARAAASENFRALLVMTAMAFLLAVVSARVA